MPQDAFHIKRLAAELQNFLVGGKVNRISQVDKDELTFIIYTGKSTIKLILSANASNARVCLSLTEKEPAPVAPNFCMLLRKHLQGAEILDVRQYAFERIIEIDFHCTTDFSESKRTLHCELMGKYSNVVLTENGVILGALKTTALEDNARRVFLSGAKYSYPPSQDKICILDGAGMRSRFENYFLTRENRIDDEELALFIFDNVAGLALPTAREIVRRVKGRTGGLAAAFSSPAAPVSAAESAEYSNAPLWEFIKDFCMNEPCAPCIKAVNGEYVDFFAFPVDGGVAMPSLCKAEDEFFTRREGKKAFENKKRKLENAARTLKKKQAKKWQDTLERLKDAEKAEEYRIKGELLTANLYRVEKGARGVEIENWYEEGAPKVKIELDATLSPAKNAQRFFKTYNKYKRAREILQPMSEAEEREIEYMDSVLCSIALAENGEDLKEIETELVELGAFRSPAVRAGGKKKEKENIAPFREYEFDGVKIYAGRNNLQNDRLLRFADADDIWLHTQKYHSSHVIIAIRGGQVRDELLLYAAEICAYYSDGRDGDKIPVDYCRRKYVKKPSKSKAGFVTYSNYKTVLVSPDPHKA